MAQQVPPTFTPPDPFEGGVGPSEGDSFYSGTKLWTWSEADDEWQGGSAPFAAPSTLELILARLTAIEVALGIDPADP